MQGELLNVERELLEVHIMLENLILARQFNWLSDRELLLYLEQIADRAEPDRQV